ncbi:MAG: GWxTD domain-containing protein [bacterium]|nr:GWxTD domain-containing protein [bacterium]
MMLRNIRSCGLLPILLVILALYDMPANCQQIFTLDAAGFRQEGGLIYLEVYFMIQRDRLKFVQIEDGYQARCALSVEVSSSDTLLSTTNWELDDHASNLSDVLPKHKLPDLVFYNFPPGRYLLKGTVTDLNTDSTYTRSLTVDLQSFSDSVLTISDIELATQLQRSDTGNKFVKSGYLVIPNPERLYGSTMPMLYYFSEIYNLRKGEDEYTVDRMILDNSGNEIKRLPQKIHKKIGANVIEVDGISIASLESGTYYLKLAVKDSVQNAEAVKQTKFFVYRPEDFAEKSKTVDSPANSPIDTEFKSYSNAQIDEAAEELEYLLPDVDYRLVRGLNTEARRAYLIRFWKGNDSNPATPANEFRALFLTRKQYADDNFDYLNRPGWKSDRGRIYIQYGPPTNIDSHTHDLDAKPYDIWYYDNVDGGVEFVFVDRQGTGDYKLAHSTKKGELYRPDWLTSEALIRR